MIKLITPLDQVDDEARFGLGTKTQTKDGNEYIYLPGITTCAQYDWVNIRTASGLSYGSVTRMVYTNAGPVAIAQAAITGPHYGWFQVRGVGWANAGGVVTSGSICFASGTAATVTTTVGANYAIYGSLAVQSGVSGGTCKVFLDYPFLIGAVA